MNEQWFTKAERELLDRIYDSSMGRIVVDEGTPDHDLCIDLVNAGFLDYVAYSNHSRAEIFCMSDLGLKRYKEECHAPK